MSDWEIDAEEGALTTAEPIFATVEASQAGMRLDALAGALLSEGSRSEAQKLLDAEDDAPEGVWVNGKRGKRSYKARAGDAIRVVRLLVKPLVAEPEEIPLDIVFEDDDVLVIHKPTGMVTHPAPGAERGTLVNAVLGYAQSLSLMGGVLRPGIVHRLDKDTSGLIMVAKNDVAHRALQEQIQTRVAERRYLALLWGVPHFQTATIDAPIGRHHADRKKMAVISDPRYAAREAKTELFVRESYQGAACLVEAKLHTGRTHQIRVHCAYIQHPVMGDPIYGGVRKFASPAFSSLHRTQIEIALTGLEGQALHAFSLAFDHPRTGERLAFRAEPPASLARLLGALRGESIAPKETPSPDPAPPSLR